MAETRKKHHPRIWSNDQCAWKCFGFEGALFSRTSTPPWSETVGENQSMKTQFDVFNSWQWNKHLDSSDASQCLSTACEDLCPFSASNTLSRVLKLNQNQKKSHNINILLKNKKQLIYTLRQNTSLLYCHKNIGPISCEGEPANGRHSVPV